MKKFLAILSIALATNAALAHGAVADDSEAQDFRNCTAFGKAVHRMVNARDNGRSFEWAAQNVNENLQGNMNTQFMVLVHVLWDNPSITGTEAEAYVFQGCMQGRMKSRNQ
jgi:hypothetical protein